MSLTPPDVYPNAAVDLDGNGRVISSDGSVTLIAREDGKVDTYVTPHFMENATVPEQPQDQPEPTATQAGSATIGTAPVDPAVNVGPENTPVNEPVQSDVTGVPASVSLGPDVNPVSQSDSERDLDTQIAEARAKLAELESAQQSNPEGNRTQS